MFQRLPDRGRNTDRGHWGRGPQYGLRDLIHEGEAGFDLRLCPRSPRYSPRNQSNETGEQARMWPQMYFLLSEAVDLHEFERAQRGALLALKALIGDIWVSQR